VTGESKNRTIERSIAERRATLGGLACARSARCARSAVIGCAEHSFDGAMRHERR
jgi:hypothetical protein